jgi:hypothetical protein
VDSSEYRKRIAQQLGKAAKQRGKQQVTVNKAVPAAKRQAALPTVIKDAGDVEKAAAILKDAAEDPGLREQVLLRIGTATGKSDALIDLVLGIFRNAAEPAVVRLAAVRVLQQVSFSSQLFQPRRPDYLAALREAMGDAQAEVRERALEILAVKKDEYAQRTLLEGLRTPAAALVAPEKAIQMLGYDVHAEHYAILRDVVQNPPNPAAKEEAVRLLAADAASQELLTSMLGDKGESAEVRKLSAAALRTMAPGEFTEQAKRIVADDDETDDVRAACLTALINAGDQRALRADTAFTRKVQRLRDRSPGATRRSAAQFLREQKKV